MTIAINNIARYKKLFNAGIGFSTEEFFYSKYDNNRDAESRYIPVNENWDMVNSLIEKSMEQNSELLWDRYKDNTMVN